jgi:hypothetical protein
MKSLLLVIIAFMASCATSQEPAPEQMAPQQEAEEVLTQEEIKNEQAKPAQETASENKAQQDKAEGFAETVIYGPARATSTTAVQTLSDHQFVIVEEAAPAEQKEDVVIEELYDPGLDRLYTSLVYRNSRASDLPDSVSLKYKVDTHMLNVRQAPSMQAKVVGSLPKGQVVSAKGREGYWTQIGPGQYVAAKYLAPIPSLQTY